jgi:transposase InsO family protein
MGKQVSKYKLSSDGLLDDYLVVDGKPVLCTHQYPAMVAAVHEAGGCRPKTNLLNEIMTRFYVGRYGTTGICSAIDTLRCERCMLQKQLPKKAHDRSIYASGPGERFQIDASTVVTMALIFLLGSHGFKYIVIVLDTFTKAAWVLATRTLDPRELVPLLIKLFDEYIVPDILHSDNGGQFVNRLIKQLADRLGFTHLMGPVRMPQAQGQVDRLNKTIKRRLFEWIYNHWKSAAENWPTVGVKFVGREYNRNQHSTTHLPPDLLRFGRLKTPGDRSQHKGHTASLLQLLNTSDGRFDTVITKSLREKQDENYALNITRFLEAKNEGYRTALTWTAKTQICNQLRRTGKRFRVDALSLLKIGAAVSFARPRLNTRKGRDHAARNPHLTRNVKGVITAKSIAGLSACATWKDEDDVERQTWITPREVDYLSDNDDLPEDVPPTPSWKEIRELIANFAQKMSGMWRDTKGFCKCLRDSVDTLEDIEDAKRSLKLPSLKEVGPNEYADQIVSQVLDAAFVLSLRTRFPSLALRVDDEPAPTPHTDMDSDSSILLRYVHQQFGYDGFMGAVAQWRADRRANPIVIYSEVLTILHDETHDCAICALSEKCQPEHVCCRDFVLQKFVAMRWAIEHPVTGFELTKFPGKSYVKSSFSFFFKFFRSFHSIPL